MTSPPTPVDQERTASPEAGEQTVPSPARRRWRRAALRALLLGLAGTAAYGVAIERRWVEITRHEVPLPGLPDELDGLRVVQVSDLHLGWLCRAGAVREVIALVQGCRPDLVVLTGDFVSYRSLPQLPAAARELGRLQARLGTYACLGNHEHWEDADQARRVLEGAGIPVLVNQSREPTPGLWVAGVDDLMAGRPDLEATAAGIPKGAAVVLLSHSPSVLPQVAGRPWLVLAGHTHGGQVALPVLGPRGMVRLPGVPALMYAWEWVGVKAHHNRTEAICSYRYPAGWYEEGQARMYVSRGVGSHQVFPVRLNCRPEVACLVLRAGRGSR